MSLRIIVGVAALACSSICGVASTFLILEMVDRVNERLPKDQQFSQLWWYWSKTRRLLREYKRLYPDGRLRGKFLALVVLMFACILTTAWEVGLFGR